MTNQERKHLRQRGGRQAIRAADPLEACVASPTSKPAVVRTESQQVLFLPMRSQSHREADRSALAQQKR
ncbi:hypothetical protein CHARACLAT_003182 [Characodon lateralis]|uniref:Uncharacterized protein n=1 Tax=Characodon lateralis TaxID=208331 RepID=A0ABU7DDK5_9TELE|nr:hypothetical protein [Characodon lateralis]